MLDHMATLFLIFEEPQNRSFLTRELRRAYVIKASRWDFPGGLVVGTSPSNAGGAGSIPGRGAGIPHASRPKDQSIKQKQYCNKFNKDFKDGPHQQKNL